MRVRILRNIFAPSRMPRVIGDVAELDDALAKELIRMKKAEPYAEPAPRTPAPAETTEAPPNRMQSVPMRRAAKSKE